MAELAVHGEPGGCSAGHRRVPRSGRIEVTLFEQARAHRGRRRAGRDPNAARLLRRLGQFDQFRRRAVALDVGWEFRRWENGRVLFSQPLGEACERRHGGHFYVAHRADLLETLRAGASAATLRLGCRLVSLSQSAGAVDLTFADGTRATAEVVIGADGVHTTVGPFVTSTGPPRFSGICAYRCLVPADRAPAFARRPVQTLWLGPGRHLVHYPICGGGARQRRRHYARGRLDDRIVVGKGSVEDLRAEFAGWSEELTDVLAGADRTGRWALLDRDPLPRWTDSAVALLGDAAHPMFPFLGQGAAQAIEDAAVLAACLVAGSFDPAAALRRYEQVRRPRATRIHELSRGRQETNHLPDGPAQQARDAALAGQDPLTHNDWIYRYDAELAERQPTAASPDAEADAAGQD